MENAIASWRAVWCVHRDSLFEILAASSNENLRKGQFHIDFHPEGAQPHEIVNNLARVRTVIEQAILEHHFLGVKADPVVCPES